MYYYFYNRVVFIANIQGNDIYRWGQLVNLFIYFKGDLVCTSIVYQFIPVKSCTMIDDNNVWISYTAKYKGKELNI